MVPNIPINEVVREFFRRLGEKTGRPILMQQLGTSNLYRILLGGRGRIFRTTHIDAYAASAGLTTSALLFELALLADELERLKTTATSTEK